MKTRRTSLLPGIVLPISIAMLLLLALPTVAHAQFDYTTQNGTITITSGYCPGGAVTIPDTINGLPVTSIGDYAFSFCSSLTSVIIPNSVTSIAESAFVDCGSLSAIEVDALNSAYSSVDGVLFNKSQTALIQCPTGKAGSYTIPNSVTSIGNGAFSYCQILTSVTIPNSVIIIGKQAFDRCGLTSVTIPNSVTTIGGGAFNYCTRLSNVTIGNSVTTIGNGALYYCTSLASVTIPNSVTRIGDGVFQGCERLKAAYFQGNAPRNVPTADFSVAPRPCSPPRRPCFTCRVRRVGVGRLAELRQRYGCFHTQSS